MNLIVSTFAERFKQVHQVLRDEVAGLTPEQLDYVPAPEANSITVLVTHVVGSEAMIWSTLAGQQLPRDRAAEFATVGKTADELIARLDAADRLIDELAPSLGPDVLEKEWPRRGYPTQTGALLLINNYGHAREHVAHLQLTKQLCPDCYPPPARPV